jgi:hypothetical protein
MGSVLNTSLNEGGQIYFVDPTTGMATLYFLAIRDGGLGSYDIYQSTRNPDGTYNNPTNVTPLNSSSRDASPAIRADGLEMFFYSERNSGPGLGDIMVSTRASTLAQWNPPVTVNILNTVEDEHAPALSADGSVLYFASPRLGGFGSVDIYAATRVSVNRTPTADFDGDGRTDLSVFRPSDGNWWVMSSADGTVGVRHFGANGDKIVPGDYDGDGRIDLGVFRPSDRNWYVQRSSDGTVTAVWP